MLILNKYIGGESDLAVIRIALDYYAEKYREVDAFFSIKLEMKDGLLRVETYHGKDLMREFSVMVKSKAEVEVERGKDTLPMGLVLDRPTGTKS